MKQIILILTVGLSFFGEGIKAQENSKPMKILVAYYSYSGNTRTVAKQIQEVTGADLFEIAVNEAYPTDYQQLLDRAKREIHDGVKPVLKEMPENLAEYDVIIVGSPNWWSTIAPPVNSFLSNANLTDKKLAVFVTHGGGGMAKCETEARKVCPQAKTLKGFAVNGSSVNSAAPHVMKWLKEIGLVE